MGISIKFLIISHTHTDDTEFAEIRADVAIHCGDLTNASKLSEFRVALQTPERLNALLKLIIAGNQSFTLDTADVRGESRRGRHAARAQAR
ncbi:hypothetical protein GGR56DRAFT_613928 [Xylariaceae sp. FL0804]|nr:hypothetical protein GGR56DRAFT_613928 [Xylariaceae sp. FL0804]